MDQWVQSQSSFLPAAVLREHKGKTKAPASVEETAVATSRKGAAPAAVHKHPVEHANLIQLLGRLDTAVRTDVEAYRADYVIIEPAFQTQWTTTVLKEHIACWEDGTDSSCQSTFANCC